MKGKQFIRKGTIIAGAIGVMLGMWGELPGAMLKAEAAESTLAPRAYATKAELMSQYTLKNQDDAQNQIGYIWFGEDGSGTDLKWYIVGKDSGIETDNIVLFSAYTLQTEAVFENTQGQKTYSPDWNCTYESAPTEVYQNHYGASDIRRAVLNSMEGNTDYFSAAEQALMNHTMITTTDAKNESYYTVTDVLYLPGGTAGDEGTLSFGSKDDLTAYAGNVGNGQYFWLREPDCDRNNCALVSTASGSITAGSTVRGYGLHPAFNLNLSSVLFASGAKPAEEGATAGRITEGSGMGLRLDGSTRLEDVAVSCNSKYITVEPVNGEKVTLVVQGSDGTLEWYYALAMYDTKVVPMESIAAAVDVFDLERLPQSYRECKIWIEQTAEDGMVYAKEIDCIDAIEAVSIEEITEPEGGVALDMTAVSETVGILDKEALTVSYTENGTPASGTADFVKTYTASVTLTPADGYKFLESTTATINGTEASAVLNDDGTLTVTYTFPETLKAKLLRIIEPSDITGVANGTAKTAEALGLPKTVQIVTEDVRVTSAKVAWDLEHPVSGSYDPSVKTEQTFTLNGIVTLPEGIDADHIELKVQITVTVSAAKNDSGDDGEDNGGDNGEDNGEDNGDNGEENGGSNIIDKPWPFTDIPELPGYWKYDNVKYVYDRGIMNGIAGTTLFDPDGKLNRAMFATVLYRMAGSPKVEFTNTFSDVEDGKYYSDAVMWVNQKGIAQGFQDGTYGVTRNITREQIAKMLCEYATKQGYDVSGRSSLESFTDKDSVNYWAVDYIQWTVNTGMISGKPNDDGSFRLDPKGEATRAECAKMLTMFLKQYAPEK